MNVLDEFKNYKRKFIQISHRTAILMHIFEKSDDDFEDIILSDHECAALTDEIRRKKPKYALCGHVHTGNHNITACPVYDYVFQEDTEWTNVRVANVSILDESYSIYFKPLTFEL